MTPKTPKLPKILKIHATCVVWWVSCMAGLAAASATSNAAATEYFVALDGSNAGPGTFEQPLATIQHALTRATSPGDVVTVRGGVWNLTAPIQIFASGTPDAPITLRAYNDEVPILSGQQLAPQTSVMNVSRHDVVIDGFEVRDSPWIGISVWGPGTLVYNVIVRNCVAHHCERSGIYAGYNEQGQPVRDVRFENNTCYRNSLVNENPPASVWAFGLGGGNCLRITAVGNTVYENFGEGIGFYLAEDCVATDNDVRDSYSINFYLDNAVGCLLERNRSYATGLTEFYRFNEPAASFQIATEGYPWNMPSERNTIRSNHCFGTRSAFVYGSYQVGGGLRDSKFINNTVHGTTTTMIAIDADNDGHANSVIANNIFAQVGAVSMTYLPDPAGVTWSHNVWSGGIPWPDAASPDDINGAPGFADAFGVDGVRGTADDDLRLLPGSPCIDSGSQAHANVSEQDVICRPRVRDGNGDGKAIIDRGAYEYDACPADLDGDGTVDVNDLLSLLSGWGTCTCPCNADQDQSGDVNVTDLLVLLAEWGAC